MSKRLLIVSGIFPPDSGGPAKFASEFGIWSSRQDLEVSVLAYSGFKTNNEHIDSGLNVEKIYLEKNLFVRYFRTIVAIASAGRSSAAILSVGCFIETYFASFLGRFEYVAKVPGDIVWERARNRNLTKLGILDFQKSKLSIRNKFFRILFTLSLKRATHVIVPSIGLRELCIGWGVLPEKIEVIHNSINLNEYTSWNNREIKYDVVTVCRLVPWKNVDEIIQYCAARGLSLAVAGEGPERWKLEELSRGLNSKVTFLGNIPAKEIAELLAQSRIFVLNSDYEGLPHALIEARATGLISVARTNTGSAEVINDDLDGFLVRRNRTFEMTMDTAINHSIGENQIGALARLDTETRFNQEINLRKIYGLLMGSKT